MCMSITIPISNNKWRTCVSCTEQDILVVNVVFTFINMQYVEKNG